MQVQRVQSNNYNQTFGATLKVNKPLQKFKSSLNPAQAEEFKKCLNTIERVQDGRVYIYDLVPISHNKMNFAKISEIGSNGKPNNPPMFVDCDNKDPLNVFKQLADLYKHIVQ